MSLISINIDSKDFEGISNAIQELTVLKKKMADVNYQEIKNMLEMSLNTKTLVTLVENQYRGFGKTQALVEKAKELDATLVVPQHALRHYPSTIDVIGAGSGYSLRGKIFKNGFLVDEGVNRDVIREMSMCGEFLGGFARL